MRIALIYYSKTGNTLKVIKLLRRTLADMNMLADVYTVLPVNDYGKPLHMNPRIIYDTLIRKDTEIKIEPSVLDVNKYELIVIASPIWFNTLASPIQGFLKRHKLEGKRVAIIITSTLPTSCLRIEKVFEELGLGKPMLCVNITTSIIKDEQKLEQQVYAIAKRILE